MARANATRPKIIARWDFGTLAFADGDAHIVDAQSLRLVQEYLWLHAHAFPAHLRQPQHQIFFYRACFDWCALLAADAGSRVFAFCVNDQSLPTIRLVVLPPLVNSAVPICLLASAILAILAKLLSIFST